MDYQSLTLDQEVVCQQVHSTALHALPETALAGNKLLPFSPSRIFRFTVAGNMILAQEWIFSMGTGEASFLVAGFAARTRV